MADSATPMPKELARRLLAYEVASAKPAEAKDSTAFRVCEKLRRPLGKFLGVDGFRCLLARALALAGAEIPWMRALHIKANGSLGGWDELKTKLDSRSVAEGELVLVEQLLGLLVIFIGGALTSELLHDIWPRLMVEISEGGERYEEK